MKNSLATTLLAVGLLSGGNALSTYSKNESPVILEAPHQLSKESWDTLCQLQGALIVEHVIKQVQLQFDMTLRDDIRFIKVELTPPKKKVTAKEGNPEDQILLKKSWEEYENGTKSEIAEDYMLLKEVPNPVRYFAMSAEKNGFSTSRIDCTR